MWEFTSFICKFKAVIIFAHAQIESLNIQQSESEQERMEDAKNKEAEVKK